jgi:hypothetical protein
MNLTNWETTIQQIIFECSSEPSKSGKNRVLTSWRAQLEQAPASLLPFQIDEIVRAVRDRIVE